MYTPNYISKFVKKQTKPFQAVIENEVLFICDNPETGQLKKGDLSGIRVYKFKHQQPQYLIAYSYSPENDEIMQILLVNFYKIGTHENFYSGLKKIL